MIGDVPFELSGKRVWVAGHRGMVGSAIVRRLASEQCEVITAGRDELDCAAAEVAESSSFSAANSVFSLANSALSASMRWRKSAGLNVVGELDELAVLVVAVSLPPPASPAAKRPCARLDGAPNPNNPNVNRPKHTP